MGVCGSRQLQVSSVIRRYHVLEPGVVWVTSDSGDDAIGLHLGIRRGMAAPELERLFQEGHRDSLANYLRVKQNLNALTVDHGLPARNALGVGVLDGIRLLLQRGPHAHGLDPTVVD